MQNIVFYYAGADPDEYPGEIIETVLFEDEEDATAFDAYIADNPDDLTDAAWIIDADWTAETDDALLVGPATHYIADVDTTPAIELRPTITGQTEFTILADGTDTVTIEDLPAGTVVTFDFTDATTTLVSMEDLVITTTIRGVWRWQIEPPFPYLPCVITVRSDGIV